MGRLVAANRPLFPAGADLRFIECLHAIQSGESDNRDRVPRIHNGYLSAADEETGAMNTVTTRYICCQQVS